MLMSIGGTQIDAGADVGAVADARAAGHDAHVAIERQTS